jgi:hypothetical protein
MRIRSVHALVCTGLTLAVLCVTPFLSFSPTTIEAAGMAPAPSEPYGYADCPAPAHPGFNICNPGEPSPNDWSTGSPVQVMASATSGTGQVVTMEVWADGHKEAESVGSPFDAPISLSDGNHTLQLVAIDSTGAELKSDPFKIDVTEGNGDGDCSAPNSPGVHICSPINNGCNSQPWVNLIATGKGASGTVKRMELWNYNTELANFPGDHFNTNIIMVFGTLTVVEVDSKGNSKSSSIFFNGPC